MWKNYLQLNEFPAPFIWRFILGGLVIQGAVSFASNHTTRLSKIYYPSDSQNSADELGQPSQGFVYKVKVQIKASSDASWTDVEGGKEFGALTAMGSESPSPVWFESDVTAAAVRVVPTEAAGFAAMRVGLLVPIESATDASSTDRSCGECGNDKRCCTARADCELSPEGGMVTDTKGSQTYVCKAKGADKICGMSKTACMVTGVTAGVVALISGILCAVNGALCCRKKEPTMYENCCSMCSSQK